MNTFGESVSIVGSRAIIGVSGDGIALVFRLDSMGTPSDQTDDAWVQEAELIPFDRATNDGFGGSVAFDGTTVVVGAEAHDDVCPGTGDALSCRSGAAYVFQYLDGGPPLRDFGRIQEA